MCFECSVAEILQQGGP